MSTETNLVGVDPVLAAVARRAIEICAQPCTVFEGLRTQARQNHLLLTGASTTLNSKHLTGEAVDIVALVDGRLNWEWRYFYAIAEAMRTAGQEAGISLRWGGAWDLDLCATEGPAKAIVEAYGARRRAKGKRIFIDGPHFELRGKP